MSFRRAGLVAGLFVVFAMIGCRTDSRKAAVFREPRTGWEPIDATNASDHRSVIAVSIDGMPARLVLDPGVRDSELTRPAAARLHLSRSRQLTWYGAERTVARANEVTMCGMRFGPADFHVPGRHSSPLDFGTGVDGVFGMHGLANTAIAVDFQRNRVRLWWGGLVTRSEMARAGYHVDAVAMQTSGPKQGFRVSATLNHRSQLDIGVLCSDWMPVHLTTAEAHDAGLSAADGDTLGPPYNGWTAEIAHLKVGTWSLWHVPVLVSDRWEYPWIGTQLMRINGTVIVDAPAAEMYIAHDMKRKSRKASGLSF